MVVWLLELLTRAVMILDYVYFTNFVFVGKSRPRILTFYTLGNRYFYLYLGRNLRCYFYFYPSTDNE